ncbi:c-type cytochrome [Hwanghaeella sp.]|uniref:c-type cytochrome n=1 Tax=Hwanghaeella sp. TaxID=2605943 RepID=UPI003CCC24C8
MHDEDPLMINKVAAAVLTAGLIAMTAGFISTFVYHPTTPEENAFVIEVQDDGPAPGPAEDTGPEPIEALLASADLGKGEKLLKKCTACHKFEQGGANGVGPALYGVVGRPKAGADGFSKYSDAMKAAGGEWTFEDLNHFLYKPKDFIAGTGMAFRGLSKTEDRANLIAYLRTLSDNPVPLP